MNILAAFMVFCIQFPGGTSMDLMMAFGGIAGVAYLLAPGAPLPSENDYKKALEKIQAVPADPDANTIAGKYLCFVMGDYDLGMNYLQRSGDRTLRTLAEHERAPLYTDTGPKKIGMADEWVNAARSYKPLYKIFYDRAAYWYGQSWEEMKNQPLWGDKLRERLRRLYTVNPAAAAAPPKRLVCPTGWKCPIAETKADRSQAAIRNGLYSLAITGWKSPLPAYGAAEQSVAVMPGVYKVSGWVISDGTDADDSFLVNVQNAAGTNLVLKPIIITPDRPWWRKIEADVTVPANGVRMGISIVVGSKQGMIYVDDVSIKGPDGKELLRNGGFEER